MLTFGQGLLCRCGKSGRAAYSGHLPQNLGDTGVGAERNHASANPNFSGCCALKSMKVRATVLGIGAGIGLAFGTIVLHPEAGTEVLGGFLGFISVLYLADLIDKYKA